jgi:hypothetical protein
MSQLSEEVSCSDVSPIVQKLPLVAAKAENGRRKKSLRIPPQAFGGTHLVQTFFCRGGNWALLKFEKRKKKYFIVFKFFLTPHPFSPHPKRHKMNKFAKANLAQRQSA